MSVLVPRTRVVGVRLSAEEFTALEKFSIESGAHSVSEVARKAIAHFLHKANRKNAAASSASRNLAQVQSLEERLRLLTVEIEILKANGAKPTMGGRDALGRKRRANGA